MGRTERCPAALAAGRGLATRLSLLQRVPRRAPRRALPPCAGCARRRVLHARRVERRAPAALVVLSQLQIIALAVHPDGDVADAGPGVEPGPQCPREQGARGESECRSEELAAGRARYWMISSALTSS